MRILVAPNAYKGSLSAPEAARAIARGLKGDLDLAPLSDGGEGFLEALLASTGGVKERAEVTDAAGRPVQAAYGVAGDTVIVELVSAAGLASLPPDLRNPLRTTTYGVGELIRIAWERTRFRRLLIGLGGSATVDGGAGMLEALGLRLLDSDGISVPRGGGGLRRLASLDASQLSPALQAEIQVAVDVQNVLLGPRGAAPVYGPQKGATPEMVGELEAGLTRWADALERATGQDVRHVPGTGAAGGVFAGLLAFARARAVPGFDLVAEAVGLEARLESAEIVITGEGGLDDQSFEGKVIGGLAERCQARGIPLVVIAGCVTSEGRSLLNARGGAAFSLVPGPVPLEDAQRDGAVWLEETARQIGMLLDRSATRLF